MPQVSVIIPTFNRSNFIGQAIESVLTQSFQDWELIVMDNGSTDGTREILQAYMKKDRRISSDYDPGRSLVSARRSAVILARGEFIAFLDDDDIFFANKLETQVKFLNAHPETMLVYSYVEMIDGDGKLLCTWPDKPAASYLELVRGNTIQLNSALIRKEVFGKLAPSQPRLESCDDYELCLRIAKSFPIAFLPEKVGVYRIHPQNMSHKKVLRIKSEMKIYKRLWRQSPSPEEKTAIIRRVLALTYWRASDALTHHNYSDAFLYYVMALYFNPFIGLQISWGKFSNPFYRFIRPYVAMLYSGMRYIFAKGVSTYV